MPEEYSHQEIPEHWKTLLTPVVPEEKGYPKFRNVYLSHIKATNVREFISASGWNDTLRLENFFLYAIEAQAQKAGQIRYSRNFNLAEVTLDTKDNTPIISEHNDKCNMQLKSSSTGNL